MAEMKSVGLLLLLSGAFLLWIRRNANRSDDTRAVYAMFQKATVLPVDLYFLAFGILMIVTGGVFLFYL